MLLKNDANPNIKDHMGFSAFHQAANSKLSTPLSNRRLIKQVSQYKTLKVKRLPSHEMEEEVCSKYQSTSLDMCELFISYDADVNILDSLKCTPLHYAAESGNEEVCHLLLQNGADINVVGGIFQRTPLHVVVAHDYPNLVSSFLDDPNIMPNIFDGEKDTPLEVAIKLHKKECVRRFIMHDNWVEYMSVSTPVLGGNSNRMDTPMRHLIRHMPDMATLAMNKCIELSCYKDAKNPEFTARFYFAFLDDTYTSTQWKTTTGNLASAVLAQRGNETTVTINDNQANVRGILKKRKKDKVDGFLPLTERKISGNK